MKRVVCIAVQMAMVFTLFSQKIYAQGNKASFSSIGVKHLAIIPDGNRRWAKNRGQDKYFGHSYAFNELLPRLLDGAYERDLHTFTIWLF